MRTIASCCLLLAVACSEGDAEKEEPTLVKSALSRVGTPSSDGVAALSADNRAFAFALYREVAASKPGQNLLLAPYSISTALSMAYAGARGNTESEMKSALHFTLAELQLHEAFNAADLTLGSRGEGRAASDGSPFRLHTDNSIWSQQGLTIQAPYLDTLASNYGAGVYLTDFIGDPEGSRLAINALVSEQTESRIEELLPPRIITSLTRVVLTNAVYLNASWQEKFDPIGTANADFTRLDGSKQSTAMLSATRSFDYAAGPGYTALALPYDDARLRFVAVLPDVGAFSELEAALAPGWFDALNAAWSPRPIALLLPKLTFTSATPLSVPLQALGMIDAFKDEADFSGITGDKSLRISEVVHQAAIELNEEGTVAAAATAVVFTRKLAIALADLTVRFDRPFLFAIVDQPTGSLLFLGRVLDPSAP